jgi:hypothetical protein
VSNVVEFLAAVGILGAALAFMRQAVESWLDRRRAVGLCRQHPLRVGRLLKGLSLGPVLWLGVLDRGYAGFRIFVHAQSRVMHRSE